MPYYPSDFRELSISSPACMSAGPGALGACSRREVREGRKPLVMTAFNYICLKQSHPTASAVLPLFAVHL